MTVEPITWDVIGLDSNAPAAGPKYFPVGVRITNTSGATSGALTATFNWENSVSPFQINLRSGTLATLNLGTLTAGASVDAYFEVEITQVSGAYGYERGYYISVDEGGVWNADSPRPRALYVEHLVSQARNDVTTMYLSTTRPNPALSGPYGTSIADGGNMTLMVGQHLLDHAGGQHGHQRVRADREFHQLPQHHLPDPGGRTRPTRRTPPAMSAIPATSCMATAASGTTTRRPPTTELPEYRQGGRHGDHDLQGQDTADPRRPR